MKAEELPIELPNEYQSMLVIDLAHSSKSMKRHFLKYFENKDLSFYLHNSSAYWQQTHPCL